jgi:integrase/recombinase XerC
MPEHQINPIQHNLQRSLDATINTSFDISVTPDVLQQLLEDKRSPNTRAAYQKIETTSSSRQRGNYPPRSGLRVFAPGTGSGCVGGVKYKAALFERGLSEATVNRRLAAVRALVAKGRALGIASFTLEDVKGEKVAEVSRHHGY